MIKFVAMAIYFMMLCVIFIFTLAVVPAIGLFGLARKIFLLIWLYYIMWDVYNSICDMLSN